LPLRYTQAYTSDLARSKRLQRQQSAVGRRIDVMSEGRKKSDPSNDPPITLPRFLQKYLLTGVYQCVSCLKYHSQASPVTI
jgi:hypothetical protein